MKTALGEMILAAMLLPSCSAQATLSRDLCHFNFETYMSLNNLSISRTNNMHTIVSLEGDIFRNEQEQAKVDQKIKHLKWREKRAKRETTLRETVDKISLLNRSKEALIKQKKRPTSELDYALKKDGDFNEQLALAMMARGSQDHPSQRRRLI